MTTFCNRPLRSMNLLNGHWSLTLLGLALLQVSNAALGQTAKESASKNDSRFTELFSGTDLTGWTHKGNWKVEDGVITRGGKGGSLVYDAMQVPDNFELQFDWKVAEGSNSGVYYRPGQYEYQILDNAKHKDGKNPRTSAASLYFCMQPSHDATRPVGEWNSGKVICQGSVIQHWLNGKKIIDFDYEDPTWTFNVDMLKNRGGDVAARGAKLSLQDHGDPVWYRSIRIRALGKDEKLDRSKVTPQEIADDVLAAEKQKLDGIIERRNKQQQKKAETQDRGAAEAVEAIK